MNGKKCLCTTICFILFSISVIFLILISVMVFVFGKEAVSLATNGLNGDTTIEAPRFYRRGLSPASELPLESQAIPIKISGRNNGKLKNIISNGPFVLQEPVKIIPKHFFKENYADEKIAIPDDGIFLMPKELRVQPRILRSEFDEISNDKKNEINNASEGSSENEFKKSTDEDDSMDSFITERKYSSEDTSMLLPIGSFEKSISGEVVETSTDTLEFGVDTEENLTEAHIFYPEEVTESKSVIDEQSLNVYKEVYEQFQNDFKKAPFGDAIFGGKSSTEFTSTDVVTEPILNESAADSMIELALATSVAPPNRFLKKESPILAAFRELSDEDLDILKKFFNTMSGKSKKKKIKRSPRIHKKMIPLFPFHRNSLDFSQGETDDIDYPLPTEGSTPDPTTEVHTTTVLPTTKSSEISQQQKRQVRTYSDQPTVIQPFLLPPPPPPPPSPFKTKGTSSSSKSLYGIQSAEPLPVQKPIWIERLESESSAERTARVQNDLQRLIQFVSLLSHVDGFLATRTRSAIKKFALLLDDDDEVSQQYDENRRKKRNNNNGSTKS